MEKRDKVALKQLAQSLKKARLSFGISQESLALQSDLDRTYLSKIERGIANPSYLVLIRIAAVLKVSVKDLL